MDNDWMPKFSDSAVLTILAKECPRRPGTKAAANWALYRPGMTIATLRAVGGTKSMLETDIYKNRVAVQSAVIPSLAPSTSRSEPPITQNDDIGEINFDELIAQLQRYNMAALLAHEELWVWRNRKTGIGLLAQQSAAKMLDVTLQSYYGLESGDIEIDNRIARLTTLETPPTVTELCVLARRRAGYTVDKVASLMGITRAEYQSLVRKGDPRAVTYWTQEGYRFPANDDTAEDSIAVAIQPAAPPPSVGCTLIRTSGKRRGPPPTGDRALTNAERQRRWRNRHQYKAEG